MSQIVRLAAQISGIAVSTLLKAILGLVISSFVLLAVPDAAAAAYFQLLLLQSILTTFISGAAYARGAKAGLSKQRAHALFRFQLWFAVASAAVACGIALALLPSDYLNESTSLPIIVSLLSLGCIGSAMTSLLQGLLTPTLGRRTVFAPVATVNGIGLFLCLLLVAFSSLIAVTMLLVLVQVGPALFLMRRWLTSKHLLPDTELATPGQSDTDWSPLLMGLGNVIFLAALFGLREAWMLRNDPTTVSNVFFILRASDLLLGVPFLFMSGSAAMERIARRTVVGSPIGTAAVAGGALALGTISAATLLNMPSFSVMSIPVSLVLAQLICDANRLGASVMNIVVMRSGSSWSYLLVLSCSGSLMTLLMVLDGITNNEYGVYAALVAASAAQVIMNVTLLRKEELRHGTRTIGSLGSSAS